MPRKTFPMTEHDPNIKCLLCLAESSFFALYRNIGYYRCGKCLAIFMAPRFHPSPEREKARYETHNNDINDPGYREFVRPLVNTVTAGYGPKSTGLDFGAGTGPVAATILGEQGYDTELYDPFFFNDTALLEKKYDYIICSEVIEHFHQPRTEFMLLRSLLKPGGNLYCMTWIYSDDIEFMRWRYKDDDTHVIFYHHESLRWIKDNFRFESVSINNRIIDFKAGQ